MSAAETTTTEKTFFDILNFLKMGKVWAHPKTGEERLYLNEWEDILDISISYYGTGNVSSFYIGDVKHPNSRANEVPKKVWIDKTGEIHIEGLGNRFPMSYEEIENKLKEEIMKKYNEKNVEN
jgi:hypothetical protein